jgi:hypothetical protein
MRAIGSPRWTPRPAAELAYRAGGGPPPAAELARRAGGGPRARCGARLQQVRALCGGPQRPSRRACGGGGEDELPTAEGLTRMAGSGGSRRDGRAPCEMRHGSAAPSPHLPLLHTPSSSADRLPPSLSRAADAAPTPSLPCVCAAVNPTPPLPPLLWRGVGAGRGPQPSCASCGAPLPPAARRGRLGTGEKGGNFTFSQCRIISFYCPIYQTRTHQPSLSILTLTNTRGLH